VQGRGVKYRVQCTVPTVIKEDVTILGKKKRGGRGGESWIRSLKENKSTLHCKKVMLNLYTWVDDAD